MFIYTVNKRIKTSSIGYFVFHSDYQGKPLHIISNSEYPQSKFAHFEDGPSLVADTMLPNFLSKLRQYWLPRKGAKMECRGQRYELNDFLIKIGVLSLGSNTRGLGIEVCVK